MRRECFFRFYCFLAVLLMTEAVALQGATAEAQNVYKFTSSGTFTPSASGTVDVLVIAGGGGGGANGGGGGGAGGLKEVASYAVTAGVPIPVTVGAGGAAATANNLPGSKGGNSAFGTITTTGGGGGGSRDGGGGGTGGGAGGGGGGVGSGNSNAFGPGTAGEGYNGGTGTPLDLGCNAAGAGGGGRGSAGGNAASTVGGNGGIGYASSITGTAVAYAAGGGGGRTCTDTTRGIGGSGIGGNGGGSSTRATTGNANTGSGGGGGGGGPSGAAGASGVVIVKTNFSAPVVSTPSPGTYHVSPAGNDNNDGSYDRPFKTLEKARDVVRTKIPSMTADITVYLLDGTHERSTAFVLEPQDSGKAPFNIIYKAYNEKKAILSGGRQVAPSSWSLYDASKGIYRAYVGSIDFRQLYVNDIRATRARSVDNQFTFTKTAGGYTTPNTSLQSFTNKQDMEIVGLAAWKSFRCGVKDISNGLVTIEEPCWKNANLHPWFEISKLTWIENAYELLDQAGEWYLQRSAGYLYYKPRAGESMSSATVVIPITETLVDGNPRTKPDDLSRSLHNVQFKGIVFAYAGWTGPNANDGYCPLQADSIAIGNKPYFTTGTYADGTSYADGKTRAHVNFWASKSIRLEKNLFTHLGGTALSFEFGSQNNNIVDNEFRDISGSAIRIGEFTDTFNQNWDARIAVKDNLVDNNYITEVAQEYHSSVGILLGYTDTTTVTHNEIRNLPYSGISLGWGWTNWPIETTKFALRNNKVKYNHIYDVMKVMNDGAGIYSLSRQDGTEISENYIHDVGRGIESDWWAGNHGVYLDNGSTNVTVYANLLENIPGSPALKVQTWGLDATNNILRVFNKQELVAFVGADAQAKTDEVFANNKDWKVITTETTAAAVKAGAGRVGSSAGSTTPAPAPAPAPVVYDRVYIKAANGTGLEQYIQVFFTSEKYAAVWNGWNEGMQKAVKLPAGGGYFELAADFSDHPKYCGKITGIRVDPFGSDGYFGIDYVYVGTSKKEYIKTWDFRGPKTTNVTSPFMGWTLANITNAWHDGEFWGGKGASSNKDPYFYTGVSFDSGKACPVN